MILMMETTTRINFNPRSREGSDSFFPSVCACLTISIHAPAKGATLFNRLIPIYCRISIHAPAKGATFAYRPVPPRPAKISIHAPAKGATEKGIPSRGLARFQSTLPRRERQMLRLMLRKMFRFQSTLPRRERQNAVLLSRAALSISIHAPAKGATALDLQNELRYNISIHAPAKGATLSGCTNLIILIHFNPRSREGSD